MRAFSLVLSVIASALAVNAIPGPIDRSVNPPIQLCINDIVYSTSWLDAYSTRVTQYYHDPSLPVGWYALLDLMNNYYWNGTKPALDAQAADCAKVQPTVSTENADATIAALNNLISSVQVAFKNVAASYSSFANNTIFVDRAFRDELIMFFRLTNQTTVSIIAFSPPSYATGLQNAMVSLQNDLFAANNQIRPYIRTTASSSAARPTST